MKRTHHHLTPLVLASFIWATAEWSCPAQFPATDRLSVRFSDNAKDWLSLVDIDLSQAIINPTTGKKELRVTVELDETTTGLRLFSAAVSSELAVTSMSISLIESGAQPMVIKTCAGFIIAVIVLIVAGIIIYLIVKTCKKLLK